jgi:hypothetical protein
MWRHLMAARNRARRDRLSAVPMMRSRGARRIRPAFQPYRGKLAVWNDRGDRGNVGIIRSPVRASILPDLLVMSVYGTELA